MAGSVYLPGSEGHSAFGMGLGQEGLFQGNLLRQAGAAFDSRAGSLCAFPWPPGGAASGAGLLAIELASLSKDRDEARLLYSMGWETANMQFATPQAIAKVKHDLASRGAAGSIKPQRPCWRQPKKTGKSGSAIGSVPRRVRRLRKTCPHL